MSRAKQVELKVAGKKPSIATGAKAARKSVEKTETMKPKFRAGTLALSEIRKYQKSSDLLLRKRPFQRLVRSLSPASDEIRFQSSALMIFQEAAENFLTSLLEDAYRCAVHAKRVTLLNRDIVLIYKLKYSRFLPVNMA